MIRLGIIGTAEPVFSIRYLPLLKQLQNRVQIVAVYDAVRVDAAKVASCFQAEVSCSFQRLVDRPDIHGLLMLSPGWSGELPLSAAMLRNKPLFCSQSVWRSFLQKEELEKLYQETGATIVVESECRYWPSILRARELQATKLGQPVDVTWQFSAESCRNGKAKAKTISVVLDGICFLLQRTHIRTMDPETSRLLFERERNNRNDAIPVTLCLSERKQSAGFLLRIACEQGSIEIASATEITWQLEGKTYQNRLETEQTALERQFDHFCRHVSGGLIPLHDITNALWNDRQTNLIKKQLIR